MSGTIRITRPHHKWVNLFRGFVIHLNGTEVARIKNRQTIEIPVPAGRFTLRATIDWCGSKEFSGTIGEGQTLSFVVRNADPVGGLVTDDTFLDLFPATYLPAT